MYLDRLALAQHEIEPTIRTYVHTFGHRDGAPVSASACPPSAAVNPIQRLRLAATFSMSVLPCLSDVPGYGSIVIAPGPGGGVVTAYWL